METKTVKNINSVNEKSVKKEKRKQQRSELLLELWAWYKKQVDFFVSWEKSKKEKLKEVVKLISTNAIITPFKWAMIIFLLGFQIWVPIWIIVDILTKYYLVVPRNKETHNKIIQKINTKSWMDQLMRLRPTIHTEIRNTLQKHFLERLEWMKKYTQPVQSKVSNILTLPIFNKSKKLRSI